MRETGGGERAERRKRAAKGKRVCRNNKKERGRPEGWGDRGKIWNRRERNRRGSAEEDEERAGEEMEAGKEQETAGLQHCSELV